MFLNILFKKVPGFYFMFQDLSEKGFNRPPWRTKFYSAKTKGFGPFLIPSLFIYGSEDRKIAGQIDFIEQKYLIGE
jgi:hypothetical protein